MSDKAEAINCVWESKNGSNQGMNRSGRTALVWSGMRRTEWQIHLRIQASFHQCDPDRSSRGQRGSGFFNADDFSSKWMLTMLFLSFPIKNKPQMRRFTVKIYLHSTCPMNTSASKPLPLMVWCCAVAEKHNWLWNLGTLFWNIVNNVFWSILKSVRIWHPSSKAPPSKPLPRCHRGWFWHVNISHRRPAVNTVL